MRFALTALALVSIAAGLSGCSALKGDHDGEVIKPKPWGPPGGAAKFNPGARGAPSQAPATTSGTAKQ